MDLFILLNAHLHFTMRQYYIYTLSNLFKLPARENSGSRHAVCDFYQFVKRDRPDYKIVFTFFV